MDLISIILTSSVVTVILNFIFKQIGDKNQFSHERVMESYRIYVGKKHVAYTEYWPLLLEAISAVHAQRGFKQRPDIAGMNHDDFLDLIDNLPLRISSKQRSQLINSFNKSEGKSTLVKGLQDEIDDLFGKIEVKIAFPTIQKAYRSFLFNQLYFSDSLYIKIEEIHSLLKKVAITRELPALNLVDMKKDRRDTSEKLTKIGLLREGIALGMRKELSADIIK